MPKTHAQCPTCKTYRITFPSDLLDLFSEIKRTYRLKGKSITNEKIVVDIIREYRFIKDTKTLIK